MKPVAHSGFTRTHFTYVEFCFRFYESFPVERIDEEYNGVDSGEVVLPHTACCNRQPSIVLVQT